ncbi:MAG: hypothetical protein COU29_00670 [Candidatus Magasanikbacteria bacterium CG10_big_fil_rev_8_21_14_0_10_36_32]|uniref:GtrA/DPMS transmembrane domain-containing protein n=1 Tax=Candidatus Magasanikbacteria bacterium CG10_big_fil_rev_8_21_14_0_10_36_32 TaxID=1974646 RepID=A0A2M6W7L2_9BACT|nr:MAG: hypothetical protein COU29_00670 [Candidatus Magasanikbacteria bacterium CG10_big_fil_rev_8_21_14_0_10_36_32]
MAIPPRVSQVLRFLSAGGLGVLLYYLVLYGLTDLIGVCYIISAVIASIANLILSFILQKFWTFENKNRKNVRRQMIIYTTMWILFLAANLLLLYVMVEYAHFWYLAAQAIITVVLTVTSYFATKKIFAN